MDQSSEESSSPAMQPLDAPNRTASPASAAPLPSIDHLCDDTLLRILSYADLPSLVHFARGTSHALRRRFRPEEFVGSPDLWRETFANLHLAPLDEATGRVGTSNLLLQEGEAADYFDAIRHRLSLWSTLRGGARKRRKGGTRQCFSLPTRMFHFVPLVPPDMMHFPPASGGEHNEFSFSYVDDDDSEGEEEGDALDMSVQPVDAAGDDAGELEEPDHPHTLGFDPPPVEFACDSFALTSPSTGAEFVLLNPFSGAVEVYDSVLDNAISSDEGMLERALVDASEGIVRKRRGHSRGGRRQGNDRSALVGHYDDEDFIPDESSEVIAGEAIHDRLHNHKMYDTPPKRVLFSVDEYFDLDMEEYFGQHTPFADSSRRERGSVTVDWVGVDSHTALGDDGRSIAGNLIGAARILSMESDRGEEELACTEVFAWKDAEEARPGDPRYTSKFVCRAAGSFYFLDIDANYQKLYAAFQVGCCPFDGQGGEEVDASGGEGGGRQLMDIEDESLVNDDGEPIRTTRDIYCLPLIPYDNESPASHPEKIRSYFPGPDSRIVAQYPVSSFSVDPSGKILVVGTTSGTVEIWHTGMDPHQSPVAPMRLQILSVRESFMKRHRSRTMDERHPTTHCGVDLDCSLAENDCDEKPHSIEIDDNATETQDDLALLDNGASVEEEFPHKHPTTKVSQIYFPRHLPIQQCGFVTKQRSSESGTTLLLWQTTTMSSDRDRHVVADRFRITGMINLPLSAQCHPEVHFDGRRLVVFGKDHIGLIFLVYHVLSTRFDQSAFDEAKVPAERPRSTKKSRGRGRRSGEESGGVVQIGSERRIKFVNRIRHAGLGGLEYFDSTLLAANERFLLVNTKTGNLIDSDGARNACEGLLVVDLEEYGSY